MTDTAMLGEIVIPPEAWIARFMDLASRIGAWSKDQDRQVGALVVIDKGRSMSPGYNGFPPGVLDLQQRIKGPEKNKLTVHAEVNALNNADFDVRGCDLYVTAFPCLTCALQIISRGVGRVVAPAPEQGSRWHTSQVESYALLQEVGIEVVFVEPIKAIN